MASLGLNELWLVPPTYPPFVHMAFTRMPGWRSEGPGCSGSSLPEQNESAVSAALSYRTWCHGVTGQI
jgi:hypothetical protein